MSSTISSAIYVAPPGLGDLSLVAVQWLAPTRLGAMPCRSATKILPYFFADILNHMAIIPVVSPKGPVIPSIVHKHCCFTSSSAPRIAGPSLFPSSVTNFIPISVELSSKPVARRLEIGGVADHVPILAKLPATLAISGAMRLIKSQLVEMGRRATWSPGEDISHGRQATLHSASANHNLEIVREYIKNQERASSTDDVRAGA